MSPSTSRRSKAVRPPSGVHTRPSSGLTPTARRKRADPAAPAYIVVGALVAIIGLGFAMGLALSTGAADRAMALKVLPWLVTAGGMILSIVGFMRLGNSGPGRSVS
jgi:hypothetical protein